MLHTLPDSPATRRTLHDAAAELGDLDGLDTKAALRCTTNAQLSLLIAGVASARALTEDHGLLPGFVAGHSSGAFAAAVTAGVLSLTEAMAAVRLRGELMQLACANGQWGMAALIGLPLAAARALTEHISTEADPLWIANINASDQIVLGGTTVALRRAEPAAREAGARRIERLDVTIASHGPLQHDTANRLAEELAQVPRRPQQVPYLTNTRGRCVYADTNTVLDDLAQAVARTVRWYDATRLMSELGTTCAVQVPPGHVLIRLLAAAAPQVHTISLADANIDRTAAYARQHGGAT